MTQFFSALSFLTIIPVPGQRKKTDGGQVLWFPVVGLILGGALCAVDAVAVRFLHPHLAALIDVLFLAVITGGLHLDGLADTADGMFSFRGREKALEIMRDSRIGVMGALALIFLIAIKTSAILGVQGGTHQVWLLAAPAMARAVMALGLIATDYARKEGGMGDVFFQKGRYQLLALCPIAPAIVFIDGFIEGVAALAVAGITTILLFAWFKATLGGMTGDTLGATSEIIETVVLIVGGFFPHFPIQ